jgi:hypothetical protein
MAMQAETCSERQWKPTYNKAALRRRHNLQYPLNNFYLYFYNTVSLSMVKAQSDTCKMFTSLFRALNFTISDTFCFREKMTKTTPLLLWKTVIRI